MFNYRIGNKQWQLAGFHQTGQKERIFSTERERIEHSSLNINSSASNGESSRIQVSNSPVRLERMILKAYQPKLLRSSDQARTISSKP